MQKVQMRYCPRCDATMPCEKNGLNHILHIILSVITGGMWLIIYALLAIGGSFNAWKCQKCWKRT